MASSLLLSRPIDFEPYLSRQGDTLALNVSWAAPPRNVADVAVDSASPAVEERLYKVPVEVIVVLSICYGAISLVAVVGNTLVLWIVATSRRMRTETNYLIANLAISDIIIGLFSIPFHFQAALLQRWVLPRFMCAFCPFVQVREPHALLARVLPLLGVKQVRQRRRTHFEAALRAGVIAGVCWLALWAHTSTFL